MRAWSCFCPAALLALGLALPAAAADVPTAVQPAATVANATTSATAATVAAAATSRPASTLSDLLSGPVVLSGLLGDAAIQLRLRPKADEKDSVEGTYIIFGKSPTILVAGEFEQDTLVMEESVNGRDVSGQWEGRLDGFILSGTWSSDDGSVSKPFSLKIDHVASRDQPR